MRARTIGWMVGVGLVAATAQAGETVFEEAFEGYEVGAQVAKPWASSQADDGITVAVSNPPVAAEGETWLHLADPVAKPSSACANIRRQVPPMLHGELTFRLHIKSLARFAVYLGRNEASSPDDRLVGFKMHENGRVFLVNDLLEQRPSWALEAGNTYNVRLAFAPRDEEYKNVTLVFDGGEEPLKLEAVVAEGEPITAMRLTTENQDAGGEFFVTDLVLTSTDP